MENVLKRIKAAESAMEDLQLDVNEETKSSAGDKYETGRAMIQQEIEKCSQQLAEAIKSKQMLDHIDAKSSYTMAQAGSIVKTNNGNFFMAISAGQFTVDNETYTTISQASPLGSRLLKAKKDDVVSFNNRDYKVLDVY